MTDPATIYHFWKRNGKHMKDYEVADHFGIHSSTLSDILTKELHKERKQRRAEKLAGNVIRLTIREL